MPSKYQRRHYAQLAGLIADLRLSALDSGDLFMLETVDVFRARLEDVFSRDNSRFSPGRFRTACEAGQIVTSSRRTRSVSQ